MGDSVVRADRLIQTIEKGSDIRVICCERCSIVNTVLIAVLS